MGGKRLTPEQRETILRMRRDDRASVCEISTAVGVSTTHIWELTRDFPLTKEERDERRSQQAKLGRAAMVAGGWYVGGAEWTEEQDKVLRKMYPIRAKERILDQFPDRTWAAITKRAQELDVRRSRAASNRKPGKADKLFQSLREIREARGITRDALAEKAGFHKGMLARWELGEQRPGWLMFRTWLDALDYDIEAVPKQAVAKLRSRKLWLEEEDEILCELMESGATVEEIAISMKRKQSEIKKRAQTLGIYESDQTRSVSGMTRARLGR